MVYYFYFFTLHRHRIGINVAVWRCGGVADEGGKKNGGESW